MAGRQKGYCSEIGVSGFVVFSNEAQHELLQSALKDVLHCRIFQPAADAARAALTPLGRVGDNRDCAR